ncbi:NMD4 [Candida margitis]|uniref:NMD4 n=1 Tax=Candida margitis TaxID=1775924 RepID=UPI002225D9D2|nr:NMD4 [Candida margitis]KAI5953988.1 NMD4 [Candida margitis]
MSQEYDSDTSDDFSKDELFDLKSVGDPITKEDPNSRYVRLMLDHSAFVRGIGNIKRWFNDEYIKQNFNTTSDPIVFNLYIPSYTLHEFDFVKKGTSITATNAREAIKFIDNYLENQSETVSGNIKYIMSLESPSEIPPTWAKCSKFKLYSPKIKDFPNYKTKFDSNLIAEVPHKENFLSNRESDSTSEQHTFEGSAESLAEMPARLKYLIRTCIYKRFIEKTQPRAKNNIEEWKLVTEDPITKVWAKSFGIDCVNVNEAELLIFQNYDVNSFRIYNPFSANDGFDPRNDVLQNKIDSTLYEYKTVKQEEPKVNLKKHHKRKPKSRDAKSIPYDGVVQEVKDNSSSDGTIKKEKFQAINYAPRGQGKLWRP